MEHITALVCLLFVACTLGLSPAEHREELAKRKPSPVGLWFGPRLGRNKRYPPTNEFLNMAGSTCEDIEEYIRVIPWDLVRNCIISEEKRNGKGNKSSMYVPRLGRESGEEFVNPQSLADKYYDGGAEMIREVLSPNSPPFSPRLG